MANGQATTRRPKSGAQGAKGAQGNRRGAGNGNAGTRRGAGNTGGANGTQQRQPAAGMRLKQDAPMRSFGGASAFWYLQRTGELEHVTGETANPALGITNIEIFEPMEWQLEYGCLCRIRLTTLSGVTENMGVYASERTAGDIYLRESGGRKVEGKDGKEDKWYYDHRLNNATKAQILSYVHQFVVVD